MLERYFEARFVLERFRASPVGPHIDGFATALVAQGYGFQTGGSCLRHAVHLGHWMAASGLTLEAIDADVVDGFEAHLPSCECDDERAGSHERAGARVRVFLRYLLEAGVVAPTPEVRADEPALLVAFRSWMRQQRGASEWTVRAYGRVVRGLLDHLGDDPISFTPRQLRRTVTDLSAGHGASKAEQVVTATRMFLGQLSVLGRCSPHLAASIPSPARWTQTTLPKHLPPEAVEKLIASCDLARPPGLRDRAILLLLARLGVRAGDVMALRLGDLDWSGASLRVIGKGRREAWLPLPQDVGDAILAYLERSRPRVAADHVFLTARAPWRPIGSNATVASVVAHAIRRAGVDAPSFGAHLLRHSAATKMLRDGASLDGIAAILRHRSIDTTVRYARVDERLLGQVAQPWVEAEVGPAPTRKAPDVETAMLEALAQPWLEEVASC